MLTSSLKIDSPPATAQHPLTGAGAVDASSHLREIEAVYRLADDGTLSSDEAQSTRDEVSRCLHELVAAYLSQPGPPLPRVQELLSRCGMQATTRELLGQPAERRPFLTRYSDGRGLVAQALATHFVVSPPPAGTIAMEIAQRCRELPPQATWHQLQACIAAIVDCLPQAVGETGDPEFRGRVEELLCKVGCVVDFDTIFRHPEQAYQQAAALGPLTSALTRYASFDRLGHVTRSQPSPPPPRPTPSSPALLPGMAQTNPQTEGPPFSGPPAWPALGTSDPRLANASQALSAHPPQASLHTLPTVPDSANETAIATLALLQSFGHRLDALAAEVRRQADSIVRLDADIHVWTRQPGPSSAPFFTRSAAEQPVLTAPDPEGISR